MWAKPSETQVQSVGTTKYFKKCYTVITFLVFIAISLPAPATFIFLVLIGSFDSLPVIDFPEKFLWFQFYDSRLNTTLNCQCFCYQVLSVTLNRVGSRTGRSSWTPYHTCVCQEQWTRIKKKSAYRFVKMNNIKYFQTRWRENITHTDMLATFFLFTAFFCVFGEPCGTKFFAGSISCDFSCDPQKKVPAKRKIYIYCRKLFARKNLPRVNLSKVQKIQYWEIVSVHLQPVSFVQKETDKW